eukprot:SAG31_NODE_3344_length_4381_cov_3.492760_3_plen_87_part_00
MHQYRIEIDRDFEYERQRAPAQPRDSGRPAAIDVGEAVSAERTQRMKERIGGVEPGFALDSFAPSSSAWSDMSHSDLPTIVTGLLH